MLTTSNQSTWWQIPAFYSYNGTTILGCRLILNLSEAFYTGPWSLQATPWESGRLAEGEDQE